MRKAKRTTFEELRECLKDFSPYDDYTEHGISYELINNDIRKVDFDFENFSITNFPIDNHHKKHDEGYYHIGDLTFALFMAGGDWQVPVFFIAYLDHMGRVRGYVPSGGNTWNLKTKEAHTEEERELDKILFIEDILNRIEVVKHEGELSSSDSTDD